MLKNKEEKEKNITTAVVEKTVEECPQIIKEIAKGVSYWFEYLTEVGTFENDEDDQITELILMLYRRGCYAEAVGLLRLVFTAADCDPAHALLALIHDRGDDRREECFIKAFMDVSMRCKFHEMISTAAEHGEEK